MSWTSTELFAGIFAFVAIFLEIFLIAVTFIETANVNRFHRYFPQNSFNLSGLLLVAPFVVVTAVLMVLIIRRTPK